MSKKVEKPKTYLEMMEQRLITIQGVQNKELEEKKRIEDIITTIEVNIQSRHGAILELKNSIKVFKDFQKIKDIPEPIPEAVKKIKQRTKDLKANDK